MIAFTDDTSMRHEISHLTSIAYIIIHIKYLPRLTSPPSLIPPPLRPHSPFSPPSVGSTSSTNTRSVLKHRLKHSYNMGTGRGPPFGAHASVGRAGLAVDEFPPSTMTLEKMESLIRAATCFLSIAQPQLAPSSRYSNEDPQYPVLAKMDRLAVLFVTQDKADVSAVAVHESGIQSRVFCVYDAADHSAHMALDSLSLDEPSKTAETGLGHDDQVAKSAPRNIPPANANAAIAESFSSGFQHTEDIPTPTLSVERIFQLRNSTGDINVTNSELIASITIAGHKENGKFG